MRFFWRFFTFLLIGSSLFTACNLPGNSPAAGSGIEVTQTMQALATVVQSTLEAAVPGNTPQSANTPAPVETSLPAETPLPSDTATPEQSATPTLEPSFTPTATPSTPNAHVNTNTNCRSGPATAFDQLYVALAGENLKVVSRTTFTDYVLVENPRKPGQTCWLWTKYVDLSGDLASLPVATPPPTPTPVIDFSLSYTMLESCVGWEAELKVVNTGEVAFKSYKIVVKDKDSNTTVQFTSNAFDQRSSCSVVEAIPELAPGKTGYLYASSFAYDPSGHDLTATVTLCTAKDLAGTCVSKKLNFKP